MTWAVIAMGPDLERLPIRENFYTLDSRDRVESTPYCGSSPPTPALSHNFCGPLAGNNLGARQLLQLRNPTRVIEVDMRIDDQFHILDSKTQLANVHRNLAGRFREAAIDQHVARAGCNQNRAQAMRP